ncbi:DNA oxidative demethylase AlkB [Rhodoferax sp.]|uniref:DNA oxidative demethylase AlkB n=1 Tax=Rhodoferax sp. TaxID=50421 RepID=UPI0025DC431B|nr:DNA oxidative demethylase AlkB [Rhodoferax sp.]
MTEDLFPRQPGDPVFREALADGAWLLRGFAFEEAVTLLIEVDRVLQQAPWRHMRTPGGLQMAVAMTNCGPLGWTSDARGYRYESCDPTTGKPWPALPLAFAALARNAAQAVGFAHFAPDACLINRYQPGTRLSLHQDRDERPLDAPIVSVSLGLSAIFLFGGLQRSAPVRRVQLAHGDVVVWGGRSRLAFHGIAPLAAGHHALTGSQRINLTFRQAL